MSTITVRFVHSQSRTSVLEIAVVAMTTVGTLRELLMERLASEEACMMRVFVKWHVEVEVGARKRLIELTDEDAETSLSSIGISHLSEVHLDGPLTGDSAEGVGQALAVLGAQMHRIDTGLVLTNSLLRTIVAQNMTMIESQKCQSNLQHLPSEAYLARQALAAEEWRAFGLLKVMERAEEGYQRLWAEATASMRKLFQFTIDRATPHLSFSISDDSTTVRKISEGGATFRSSTSLTTANHKWAVKIIDDGGKSNGIVIGLLPKLSDGQVSQMEGNNGYIGSPVLGGWGMGGHGSKYGNWECPSAKFTFTKGDVVACDLNFAAKTLTFSCRNCRAVCTIPSIKEDDRLYPSVYTHFTGQQTAFLAQ